MSNVVPLPLPVEMFAVNELRVVPGLRRPPAPITHDAPVPLALKLPLDWAKASPTANNPVTAKTDSRFFMFLTYGPLCVFDCNSVPSRAALRRRPMLNKSTLLSDALQRS